jgi:integrase/recombinase XerD
LQTKVNISNFVPNKIHHLNWSHYIKGFTAYLQLERSLSEKSVEAYVHDVTKLVQFLDFKKLNLTPEDIQLEILREFLRWVSELGMTATSQERTLIVIKAFYK